MNQHNDMSEAAAHQLNPQCRFCELHIGERFRFPSSNVIHTKVKGGYKSPGSEKRWNTGRNVAVISVNP